MNKTKVVAAFNKFDISTILFREVGELCQQIIPEHQVFFLSLDSISWHAKFNLPSSENSTNESLLMNNVEEIKEVVKIAGKEWPENGFDILCHAEEQCSMEMISCAHKTLIKILKDNSRLANAYKGAVQILSSIPLKLGNSIKLNSEWYLDENAEASPLLRFQDALSFAANDFSTSNLNENEYQKAGEFCLLVHRYSCRPHLVQKENLQSFLAEYLFLLRKNNEEEYSVALQNDLIKKGVTFGFLPLRGLGQWRASADWMDWCSISGGLSDHIEKITKNEKLALENTYSSSIIESFLLMLLSSIEEHKLIWNHDRGIPRAFAELWWADRIDFLKNNKCLLTVARNKQGHLVDLKEISSKESESNTCDEPERSTEDEHFIRVDLIAKPEKRPETIIVLKINNLNNQLIGGLIPLGSDQKINAITSLFHFDTVRYSCRLIHSESEVKRWKKLSL